MNKQNANTDWMLITVRGYDLAKGYIYGNRHPDGKSVIIAKKPSVQRDWMKYLSAEEERTYTPPQSVIAVFGVEEKNADNGYMLASWVTPVSKDLNREDVYVTPVKMSLRPKQIKNAGVNQKQHYIDALVLDSSPLNVRATADIRSSAIEVLDKNSSTSLNLDGSRGFMVRIGCTSQENPDSLEFHSWEFFGRSSNSPEQTWDYYWNQTPPQGRQQNLLKTVLSASQSALKNSSSYVEISGFTRVLVNDFGDPKRAQQIASLPNYKVNTQKGPVATYSLAAITVNKQGSRVIKQQFPLPRNKVINHKAGVLGNHALDIEFPVTIAPLNTTPSEGVVSAPVPISVTNALHFPLSVEDHVNKQGEVRSFKVRGTKQVLERYKSEIETAAPGITPFRVKGDFAYSFPLKFRKQVGSALADLAGTPPLYIQNVSVRSELFVGVSGRTEDRRYKEQVQSILQDLGAEEIDGRLLLKEDQMPALATAINLLGENSGVNSEDLPTASRQEKNKTPVKSAISFSDWLQSKFSKDPYNMLNALSGDISSYAEEAGIDWGSAQSALYFNTANQRGKIIKSKAVRPLDKGHRGSVAMAAHLFEKQGTKPGDSILWFKIIFLNKKLLKDEVVTFDAYPFLKDEYDRDVVSGYTPPNNDKNLDEIRENNRIRERQAKQKIAEEEKKDQESRKYWARQIPTMPREKGENSYFSNKGVLHLLKILDIRSGQDSRGRYSVIPLNDMNANFVGAQRIYENYWSNSKGKKTNKDSIRGTLFVDQTSGLPYGTHLVVGEIDPLKPILFCEGVADSGTVHAATGEPVVICLNKGNLYHVVGLFRQRYPDTRLIIAHDNDIYSREKGNVGFVAALDAARDHGAEYVGPNFKGLPLDSRPSDFNDLEGLVGIDVVRAQIKDVLSPPTDLLDFYKLKLQIVGLNPLPKQMSVAVAAIIESGAYGTDEDQILRSLALSATKSYGRDEVMSALKERYPLLVINNDNKEPGKRAFPVEIKERSGVNGKKHSLVVDHSGKHTEKIEETLRHILGAKHFPFNEHLNGWVAPYPVMRLLDTSLHELTGAPQLYIGKSRSKTSGALFVVRGNFSDPSFRDKIENSIRYSSPLFKKSEYGFVIPDSNAIPYIRETLRPYISQKMAAGASLPFPPATADAPKEIDSALLDEAVRISGQDRGKIILAHYKLLFSDSKNIFLKSDFAFSSIYSRSLSSFSNLEGGARHTKALEDAWRNAKGLLDNGVLDADDCLEVAQRFNELVTHLDFIFEHLDDDKAASLALLPLPERELITEIAKDLEADIDDVFSVIMGSPASVDGNIREEILGRYQQERLSAQTPDAETSEAESNPTEAADAVIPPVDVVTPPANDEQLQRTTAIIEIVRLAVKKGFDEEELYDLFITQPGGVHYDEKTQTFNHALYRQDLRYLSSTTKINGWEPRAVNTTSQLYYSVYNDIAKGRLASLENYINTYFGSNGTTTFKTFNRYLSGERKMLSDVTHPYTIEGEVDFEIIAHDLEHLTHHTSIYDLYRSLTSEFENSQRNSEQSSALNQIESSDPQAVEGDVVMSLSEPEFKGHVERFSINDNNVYEIIAETEHEGRWLREYHGFNLHLDVAESHLNELKKLFQAGMPLNADNLPGASKGSVSISTEAHEGGNGKSIERRVVNTGPSLFYYIVEECDLAGVVETTGHGVFADYNSSARKFQNLYRDLREEFKTPEVSKNQLGIESQKEKNEQTDMNDIREKLQEWAGAGESFDYVKRTLASEYQLPLDDAAFLKLEVKYNKLAQRISESRKARLIPPQERYNELHRLSVDLAKNELSFDEYRDEVFRSDGSYVEQNPYWNASKKQIDRKSAFEDIKSAGFNSLAQMYEGLYKTIHHRTSADTVIRRVGGYIPSLIDTSQAIRPQFDNLDNLFGQANTGAAIEKLPPFSAWVENGTDHTVFHPILGLDLNSADVSKLNQSFSEDALLMLADIHGITLNPGDSKEDLPEKIIAQWHTRTLLADMDQAEIQGMETGEITDFLEYLSLPVGGSHVERCDRITGRIDQLRATSELRLAQYSFIYGAIQMENSGRRVPNYVYKGITTFINNEVEFRDSADRAVDHASTALLRRDVNDVLTILDRQSSVERAVLESMPAGNTKIFGLDDIRQPALIFGEAHSETRENRYHYKYLLPENISHENLKLVPGITHYATFSGQLVGTTSPIDASYLLESGIQPVSDESMLAILSPMESWMEKFGYAGFTTTDGETLVALKTGSKWQLRSMSDKGQKLVSAHKHPADLLKTILDTVPGFVDRSFLVEEWMKTHDDRLFGVAGQLSEELTAANLSLSAQKESVQTLISKPPLSNIVSEYEDESEEVRLSLILDSLPSIFFDEVWNAINEQGAADADESLLTATDELLKVLERGQGVGNQVNQVDGGAELVKLNPSEAARLYDEHKRSDKQLHPYFDALVEKHYSSLPAQEKHKLATDIVSGDYENIGHFIHECAIRDALRNSASQDVDSAIQDVLNKYYPEINLDVDIDIDESQKPITKGDMVLLKAAGGNEYTFGEVLGISDTHLNYKPFKLEAPGQESIDLNSPVSSFLYGPDGTYLPSLTLSEFKERDESLVSSAEYLDINPLSEDGRTRLLKLKLSELVDYARVVGANHKGGRPFIIESISNVAFLMEHASKSDDQDATFSTLDMDRIEKVLGEPAAGVMLTTDDIKRWAKENSARTIHERSRRNYLKIQKLATQYRSRVPLADVPSLPAREIERKGAEIIPVTTVPTLNNILPEYMDITEILSQSQSSNHMEKISSHAAIDVLGLSSDRLKEICAAVPEGMELVVVRNDGNIEWLINGNTYYSIQEAVSSLDAVSVELMAEGDFVGWMQESKLITGYVAGDDFHGDGITPVAFMNQFGRERVADFDSSAITKINEEECKEEFHSALSEIEGDSQSIVDCFQQDVVKTEQEDSRPAIIKARYMLSLCLRHTTDMDENSSMLPDGVFISQLKGLMYIKKTEADQGAEDTPSFSSAAEVVRNHIIQTRSIFNQERENNDDTKNISTGSGPESKPVGLDSSGSHGVSASTDIPEAQGERSLGSNAAGLPRANRETGGSNDDAGNIYDRNRRSGITNDSTGTRGIDFTLGVDLEAEVSKGPEHRFSLNIDALTLRKKLLDADKKPTEEEKSVLSKYTGWGGLAGKLANNRYILNRLLYEGEFNHLKRSVLTAFYTPPSVSTAMWEAISHIGVEPEKILDPSTGTGQFLGSAPEYLAKNSSFAGREIDSVSASIAKLLYGDNVIHQEPYEKASLPGNYFDLAISNIPFGDIRVFDSKYKKHDFRIHDYFFAKSLDKVKPGGVVAFITSTGTMDKKNPSVRKYLSDRADLLGAIRLPRNTFRGYAGTSVNADMVFLQKRHAGQAPSNDQWVWSVDQEIKTLKQAFGDDEETTPLAVNRYFIDNPGMVIGEHVAAQGQYGLELTTIFNDENTISDEIRQRITRLPKAVLNLTESKPEETVQHDLSIENIERYKIGNYVDIDSVIGIVDSVFDPDKGRYKKVILPAEIAKTSIEKLRSIIVIRDLAKDAINIQLTNYSGDKLSSIQQNLENSYDRFTDSFGPLNKASNRKIFSLDPDSALLLALELPGKQKNTFIKADIFRKPTVRVNTFPSTADSALDALGISLSAKGVVDEDYISELTGSTWDEAAKELGDRIYLDPDNNEWQTREQYLSGNIREKLNIVEGAAEVGPEFERNVSALKSVMPDRIPAYDIKIRLGAVWVPSDTVSEFVRYIVSGKTEGKKPQDNYSVSRAASFWSVKVSEWVLSENEGRVSQLWGTKRLGAHKLIDKLLNNRKIVVKDSDGDGGSIVNRDETIAANQKADAINQEFRDWIWSDPARSAALEIIYNDRYNVFVEPKYSGDDIRLVGIVSTMAGKPFYARSIQKAVIQRYITEGRSLNAHPVGAGKTLELVGSAMEGKRLGIHSKPLIVVPNNVLPQFGRMALGLYPSAKILTLTPKSLGKDARRVFTGRIATGDWDIVVIAQSSFDKISTSPEHQMSIISDERYALREMLQATEKADNRAALISVKRLERSLSSLENKIESLTDDSKKDNLLYLDEIGVDALFVDEADNYLNLHTPTQMGHVPGVNTSASQRAMNMFMAVRYIQELNGNYRGVIFATGTDVRNSMSDMYTMLRYLGPDVLEASEVSDFDSFMGTFGEVVKTVEVTPEGSGYRENSRLSKFTNIPEMAMMYRQVADVLTDKQVNIPKPKVDEINVAAEPSEWLTLYMADLSRRAKATRESGVDAREDNILKISGDGRKSSLDMRLIDQRIPDDPGSKINLCVGNVFREWELGKEGKLAQIVFCDMGVPKKDQFSVYTDIREKLINKGIPEDEVAFAQDYKTPAKKSVLDSSLNSGQIRVVIASTETLGVGSNVQERLVAQHNLDAPWRPRDLEQRGGRMERYGNTNSLTRRYNYSTIDSFDLFMWETLKRKAGFIAQVKTDPRSAAREIEEDMSPTYSDLMAITTGSPLIKAKIEIDSSVERLQSAERSHKRALWDNTKGINQHTSHIDAHQETNERRRQILKKYRAGDSSLIIGQKEYFDPKKAAAAVKKMLKEHVNKENSAYKSLRPMPLGSIGDLPIRMENCSMVGGWVLATDDGYSNRISDHKSARGMVDALYVFGDKLNRNIERSEREIERHNASINSLKEVATAEYKDKDELNALLQKQREVIAALAVEATNEVEEQQNKSTLDFQSKLNELIGPEAEPEQKEVEEETKKISSMRM